MADDMWRALVNSYEGEFPSQGKESPTLESIIPEPINDGESPVLLQKIITEVYVYTSLDTKEVFGKTQSFSDTHVLGTMRLSEALTVIEGARKRKRRRR